MVTTPVEGRGWLRIADPNIKVIYVTILGLGIAYGLAISLIGLFLEKRGYSKESIGTLALWFAGGIVALSLPVGGLMRRFSAKTVLVASLLGYAVTVALFPLMPTYTGMGIVRFFDGAFSVGVWVASETILLSRAPASQKAYVTSLYAISLALGYVIGPIISWKLAPAFGFNASFMFAGALSLAVAAFVALRLENDGKSTGHGGAAAAAAGEGSVPSLGIGAIFSRIKTACFATFSYGYFQASVVLFLPLYLKNTKHFAENDTIIVPAFFAGGMLLFANVAARAGDRFGHLFVMRLLGCVGTLTILGFVLADHLVLVFVLVFLAGASLASVSPVSLALQGTVVPARDLGRAGSLYNAAYALGMLLGPLITSQIYGKVNGDAMIEHFAGLWAVFVVFTIVFRRDDPRVSGQRIPV